MRQYIVFPAYLLAIARGLVTQPKYKSANFPEPTIAQPEYPNLIPTDFTTDDMEFATFQSDANGEHQVSIPIWNRLKFSPEETTYGMERETEYIYFPPATLIDVAKEKTIIKTPVTGYEGTIKEDVGADDWRITIRGVITPGSMEQNPDVLLNPNEYPYEEVARINAIVAERRPWKVTNRKLNNLGIMNLVVESIDFTDKEAYPGLQVYTMVCSSDQPMELVIRDDAQAAAPRPVAAGRGDRGSNAVPAFNQKPQITTIGFDSPEEQKAANEALKAPDANKFVN